MYNLLKLVKKQLYNSKLNYSFVLLSIILFTLAFFFEIFRYLPLAYIILFLIGWPFYILLTPSAFKKNYLYLFLPLIYSFFILSVIGNFIIYSNLNTNLIYIITPFISLILYAYILLSFIKKKKKAKTSTFKKNITNNLSISFLIYSLTLIISAGILLPTLNIPYMTTPYRVGPDALLYIESARYLLDGGTLNNLLNNSPYLTSTSYPILEGTFFTNPRNGLTIIIMILTKSMMLSHPFQSVFIPLLFSYLLIGVLSFYLLNAILKVSRLSSVAGSILLLFNVNILNILYEGQYSNLFTLPYMFLLIILILIIKNKDKITWSNSIKEIYLLIICTTMILLNYNDLYLLTLSTILAIIFLGIFSIRKKIMLIGIFILCFAANALLTIPTNKYIYTNVFITSLNLVKSSTAGFPQPHWAMPSEILGMSNLYNNYYEWTHLGLRITERTPNEFILNSIASIFIVLLILLSIFKRKGKDQIFLIIPILIITAIYIKLILSHQHNYTYMKTYTWFLPIIFCLFYSGLHFISHNSGRFYKTLANTFLILMIISIFYSGFAYLREYSTTSRFVTKDMFDLYTNYNKKFQVPNNILLSGDGRCAVDPYDNIMAISLLPNSILHAGWVSQAQVACGSCYKKYFKEKVNLLINKNKTCQYKNITKNNVIYNNNSFYIVKTDKTLMDSYNKQTNEVNFEMYWNLFPVKIIK